MKKFSLMAALIVIGFIVQTSLLSFFNIFGVVPNLSLVLLVVFSMMSNGITGGILGIITGAMYDAMIYDVFGVYILVYFLIGSIIGTYTGDILKENYTAYMAVSAISTVCMHFLLYLILFFLRFRVENAINIVKGILLEIILNTVLIIFVHKLIIIIFNKLDVK